MDTFGEQEHWVYDNEKFKWFVKSRVNWFQFPIKNDQFHSKIVHPYDVALWTFRHMNQYELKTKWKFAIMLHRETAHWKFQFRLELFVTTFWTADKSLINKYGFSRTKRAYHHLNAIPIVDICDDKANENKKWFNFRFEFAAAIWIDNLFSCLLSKCHRCSFWTTLWPLWYGFHISSTSTVHREIAKLIFIDIRRLR